MKAGRKKTTAPYGYIYMIYADTKIKVNWRKKALVGAFKSYPGAVYSIGKMSKKMVRNAEILKVPVGNYVDKNHIRKIK